MNRQRHVQPQFSIKIVGLSGKFADVSEYISLSQGIVYEESSDLMRRLVFTIDKFADVYIQRLHYGQKVEFYGGTLAKFKKVFSGTITRIRTILPKSGSPSLTVECMTTAWSKTGKNLAQSCVYPDLTSPRSFAVGKSSLKISDIVKGLAQEANMDVGLIDIPKGGDVEFTLTDACHQNKLSDWQLLLFLGKKSGCSVWTEFKSDSEALYFVDRSKVRNTPSDYFLNGKEITFLYPLRGKNAASEEAAKNDRNKSFVYRELRDNQVIVESADIMEDIVSASSISYGASRFDFETGEEINSIAEVITEADGKKKVVYYELDEDKVAALEEKNPQRAKELRDMGMFNIPWEIAKEFYIPKYIVDEDAAMFDQAFFGVTVTLVVPGDIDIRSQRAYLIYGILRYGSRSTEDRYWLYSLRHSWTSEGFWSELEFRK